MGIKLKRNENPKDAAKQQSAAQVSSDDDDGGGGGEAVGSTSRLQLKK